MALSGQGQYLCATGLHLHHIAHGLVKQRGIRPQRNDQRAILNEGNGAMLQLAGGVASEWI